MVPKTILALSMLLFLRGGDVYSFNLAGESTSEDSSRTKYVRIYNATRLTATRPNIDGALDDSCWSLGEWSGNFTQLVPKEGASPSQKTEIKILYDDRNIYVAIRAFDTEPEKISRKAGRRDEFVGDIVGITFDSYHDHRTGFEFDLTAAGQKIDLVLTNPDNWDVSWDAVWYGNTGTEDSAWTAEFEIPLSQLRYSNDSVQVWGIHCWRWIDRLQEESDWEPQTSTGPGILYLFGELHGINGLPKSRRVELMPYTLGKLSTFKRDANNPFAEKGRTWFGNVGFDGKIGVSSNFTVDLTVNPDFGQVEADPSVMNLTAFETFYEEKRPFFLEGKNIFGFDFDDVNLFYSRRIGHVPSYMPTLSDGEYMDFPEYTSILSAVKLSGKTANGLSVGVLQSVTAKDIARIDSSGTNKNVAVEPLTSFTIARVQQDLNAGNTVFGGIITSTNRAIKDSQLNFLNRDAYTGGIDLFHQWSDKEFYIDAKLVTSDIRGSSAAIALLQTSPARYYQRPDASYLHLDSSRTELGGYGGSIKIGKGSKGFWRYSTELDWRSPGLDFNDIGFMQIADLIKLNSSVSYFVNSPVSIFRTYSFSVGQINNWNFGMQHLSSGAEMNVYLEFLNKWGISTTLQYTSQVLDERLLRGGYSVYVPPVWSADIYVRSDPSQRVYFDCTTSLSAADNERSRYASTEPTMSFIPMNILKVSFGLTYSSSMDELQYVDMATVNGVDNYILGRIIQHTLGATFRVDYNITPSISIQYYASPFASAGKYSGYRLVTNPTSSAYNSRFSMMEPVLLGNDYEVYDGTTSQVSYTFENPDFTFCQFRSNLVLRWEYRPGSQLYLVWSQERTNYTQPRYSAVSDVLNGLVSVTPQNVFLLKLNYWFSI